MRAFGFAEFEMLAIMGAPSEQAVMRITHDKLSSVILAVRATQQFFRTRLTCAPGARDRNQ